MLYLLKLKSPQLKKGLFFASDASCKKPLNGWNFWVHHKRLVLIISLLPFSN